jgi:triosephosphate isomerase
MISLAPQAAEQAKCILEKLSERRACLIQTRALIEAALSAMKKDCGRKPALCVASTLEESS